MLLRSKNHASRSLMGFLCLYGIGMAVAHPVAAQSGKLPLQDLSAFREPGQSWSITSDASAKLDNPHVLDAVAGTGVLFNMPDKKRPGKDLFSTEEYGDVDIELDYMMAPGSNSGIYLQGRYEIQLLDSWNTKVPKAGGNGGIYERWDDSRPEGQKGYDGHAPRVNASRAPGLWQHMKISFQAPRFDASGKKTANARMLLVELNGVTIHENVELMGPTRGSIGGGDEKATGPLRFQGDHGAVAFRNITINKPGQDRTGNENNRMTDPILVDAPVNTILRSFMDVKNNKRVVHAVSVGSPEKVHYTYDLDKGMVAQVWRGEFLDATPMWHERGNGCSRPRGTVQLLGEPFFTLSKLSSPQAAWTTDTTGTGYRPKGYVLDENDLPTFRYQVYGAAVSDVVRVLPEGHGIRRELTVATPVEGLYAKLAEGSTIETPSKDLYVIDGKSYYLQVDDAGGEKPVIREAGATKELIVPVHGKLSYSILF
ncbi:DUF1080 domain-containing protein [Chitinophaga filiformis]|uniref:3-keto-disaccharide hydrolase n=1 Tax=Chitinophaga filiformis TaxID=104663 RepID=UPI001F3D19FF|nr:DUF1080 domain-containing protein [Chitinophaga filiformis]MCF6404787.1 DUF1080 domain-containing protein [Chitinophaga filiformis]